MFLQLQNARQDLLLPNMRPIAEIGALWNNAYFRAFGSIEGLRNIP
jgi:hypothetical protein